MCGECCHGRGGIFLDPKEMEKIAHFLDLTPKDFLPRFCSEKQGRAYLRNGSDNFCIFHRGKKGCDIHPVKPRICCLWPFYPAIVRDEENWKLVNDACPGINPNASFEDFVRESKV